MPANTAPIFPAVPVIGIASLASPTAITSRAKITGTTGLTQLTPASTNGKKISGISVKASASSVATNLFIWIYDGTNSYLFDEIDIPAVTAANTTDSYQVFKNYELINGASIVLPAAYQLFVSVSVQQNLTVFAHGGDY
jgi:hypothetical protein